MKYNESTQKEDDDIVTVLLSLPVKNLEHRISQLEKEIRNRQSLSDQILSEVATRQIRLEERIKHLCYHTVFSPGFRAKLEFESQCLKLESLKIHELTTCHSDLSEWREKLQDAREQLAKDRLKLNIIDSE